MRIAALVHNGVLNDARVIKEAMTLRAAGYEVDIHGIAPHEQAEHHILPGTDIEVFLEPRAAPRPAPPPPSKIDPRVPDPQVVMNASMIAPVPVYDGRLHDVAQLPREQKIILFQGGFSPHRGLPQLVEAANALPAEWTLVMMGWGGMEAELCAMVNHHSRQAVSSTVVFLPGVPQHELQQWSAGATLGVIPYENTSLNHQSDTVVKASYRQSPVNVRLKSDPQKEHVPTLSLRPTPNEFAPTENTRTLLINSDHHDPSYCHHRRCASAVHQGGRPEPRLARRTCAQRRFDSHRPALR